MQRHIIKVMKKLFEAFIFQNDEKPLCFTAAFYDVKLFTFLGTL